MMEIYKKHKFNKSNHLKYFEQVLTAVLIAEKKAKHYDLETVERIIEQKKLLSEIHEYIKGLEWLCHKETKERIVKIRDSKYNYKELSKELKVSEVALRNSMSNANRVLKEKIGERTLDLILEGKVEDARLIFQFKTGKLSLGTFIMDSALQDIPEAKYMTFGLLECKNELKYIQIYSIVHFNKRLKILDKDKMAYIRYILETDNPKFVEERKELIRILRGEKKVAEFIEELEEKEIF